MERTSSTLGLQLHDSTGIQKGRFQFTGVEKEIQLCQILGVLG